MTYLASFQSVPGGSRSILMLSALSCAMALGACGGDGGVTDPTSTPTPEPPSESRETTVFEGTFAGARQSGTVQVMLQSAVVLSSSSSVASRARVEASGTLMVGRGGGNVALEGTYDDSTGQVTLSGGGFDLAGRVVENGAELSGEYTDPTGAGGTFSTLNASAAAVDTFCGTYSGSGSGTWNLALSDSVVAGTWSPGSSGVQGGTAHGTLQGPNLEGTWSGGGDRGRFRGTRQGSSLSGTWRSTQSDDSGTFRGSTGCR